MKKELSVFIDESGDFGAYSSFAPYYIISLVLHDQTEHISQDISYLDERSTNWGFPRHAIHTGPLIRRESVYINVELDDRKRLFNALFHFTRRIPVRYATIIIKKSECADKDALMDRLSRGIKNTIDDNIEYFHQFNTIIVYYDNGQIELSKILTTVFQEQLPNVTFRKVEPVDYRLFQVADLICTLELLNLKFREKRFSKSEMHFFQDSRSFYKNYYRYIAKKRL